MKDNKQWDSVHRTLKAQTSHQDVADIIDVSCVPKTGDDFALIDKKQKQACAVFEQTLQTDEGKVIVHFHDNDPNAQAIHTEFLHSMTVSAEARMGLAELLLCLTAAKISDGNWRGATKAFVLNWTQKR